MYEYRLIGVPKVIDGDTVDATLDLGFGVFTKQRLRLEGIDTPESRTSNLIEKKYGLEAKTFLEKWMETTKCIRAKTSKDDKYGRMLAKFYSDESTVSVNEILISEGYAWSYNGNGKQKDFDELERARKTANSRRR